MKVTLKGNTSKNKTFFPATEDKPAMLYFDLAEKIKKRDNTETTIWHKIKVSRGYAEAIYRGLHGANEVSRFVQIEGRIVDAPKTRMNSSQQIVTYNTIWVDELTWMDQKWPADESGLPTETATEPAEVDVESPWGDE